MMSNVPPRPGVVLAIALLLAAGLYWTGLHGPFVLDDFYNFRPIQQWLDGEVSLHSVLFDGRSGTFGRPVAMASFVLSTWLGGYNAYSFKLGNLFLHLLCGLAVFALTARMAARDERMQTQARWIAAVIVAAWLLHPLHASTVLYAVQRMTQLSTLFTLLGLWLFMVARTRLEGRSSPGALLALFVAVPACGALGFLCKENAALLPALCLVLELGCFRQRPRAAKTFFVVGLWLPTVIALMALALHPERILGGYTHRDFTLPERLLTQARALCDYLWKTVAPNPPTMGAYVDDYAASTGWMAPPSTLLAVLALLAISLVAWRLRRQVPALLVGWSLFLVGHAMESSIIALELYFEHRNYLPMVGVLYALAGVVTALMALGGRHGLRTARAGIVLAVGLLGLLAFGMHGRARVWGSEATLAVSAVESHPQSIRANMALVKVALDRDNREAVTMALERLARADQPRTRALGLLNRVYLDCALDKRARAQDVQDAVVAMPDRMSNAEPEIFSHLFRESANCGGITDELLGDALVTMLDRSVAQPDEAWSKWNLRYTAAQFYRRAGHWDKALPQARLAWKNGAIPAVVELLVQAQLATGDFAGAEQSWQEAATRADPDNTADRSGMQWLRGQIDAARAEATRAHQPGTPP